MGVQYLYGDSQPFPDGYDFLTELRLFVEAASQALSLSEEADSLEQSLGERAQLHLHAVDALQTFFDQVTELVADRAARSGAPQTVGPWARKLLEHVEAVSVQAKASHAKDLDHDQVDVTSHIRERRAQLRKVLGDYLLKDPLPVEHWAMSLNLLGDVPSGQCVLAHPGALTTSFGIDVAGDGTWGQPRKIGEFSEGLALQVGWKKAFLRSSLHPDVAALDDQYVAALELGPDSMELRLRRKPDSPRDGFVLTIDPDEQGVQVPKITRIDEKRGESDAPFTSQAEDRARIQELFATLRGSARPLLSRKRRLVYAQLDGHDVFERGLVRALFERVAARLEPIAAQVSHHSPNPQELSLKLEREDGRREELYLRKQELVDMVQPLSEEATALFRHLAFLPAPPATPSAPPPPKRRL